MQAWWFEFGSRVEATALLYCPERIRRAMEAPAWRINQDVDHLGAAFCLRDGCLAFVARTRCELTTAMQGASRDVRVFSRHGDNLAVRIDSFGGAATPVCGEPFARGVVAIVTRRAALPLPERGTIPLQDSSTTVRRLGALMSVMPG
ncbi:hypothetical protein [Falsiroseomonas oryziterrae]|uniref:hypothetical protein n=1 Tax=Falsiroseomonas oryziterrae TaxID=2911368 RepID=UPI001F3066A6|nr:hypothetical protein [Roseomonas sp. NPKOSM-4]